MRIVPISRLGRAGVGVVALALLLYIATLVLVIDGPRPSNVLWLGPTLIGMVVGSGLALAAITRRGERALLAWVVLVPGVLVLLALIAEITGLIE